MTRKLNNKKMCIPLIYLLTAYDDNLLFNIKSKLHYTCTYTLNGAIYIVDIFRQLKYSTYHVCWRKQLNAKFRTDCWIFIRIAKSIDATNVF